MSIACALRRAVAKVNFVNSLKKPVSCAHGLFHTDGSNAVDAQLQLWSYRCCESVEYFSDQNQNRHSYDNPGKDIQKIGYEHAKKTVRRVADRRPEYYFPE